MNSIFDDLKSAIHRDSEINYRDLLRLTYPVAYPTVYTIQIKNKWSVLDFFHPKSTVSHSDY